MAGSRQHLTCSFMPTCLRCRTLVDTNVLLYVLCCSVQGRLKVAVRTVDTAPVAFGAWFVCAQKKRKFKNKKKNSVDVCSELMIQLYSSLQEEHLPSSHVHLAVALPSAMTWTEKSNTFVANMPRSQKHTRASFLLLLI